MMEENNIESLVVKIAEEKESLETKGKHPRVVLIESKLFQALQSGWLEDIKDLPWGDALVFEMEQRLKKNHDMFLGDGTLLGLWVVSVDTIEGFEVR